MAYDYTRCGYVGNCSICFGETVFLLNREFYSKEECIMAKQGGSWHLETTVIPNDMDLEHIAEMIKDGYTSGEIVQDEEDED